METSGFCGHQGLMPTLTFSTLYCWASTLTVCRLAPQLFTKALVAVLALVCSHAILILGYLVNPLLRKQLEWAMSGNIILTVQRLHWFKLIMNPSEIRTRNNLLISGSSSGYSSGHSVSSTKGAPGSPISGYCSPVQGLSYSLLMHKNLGPDGGILFFQFHDQPQQRNIFQL